MPIEGGCHCGAVRYALSAAPEASMICHCRTCRAISGAPVLAWISIAADKFAITKGAPQRYASSHNVQRQFCAQCGTQLTYIGPGYVNAIDVTTASLDDRRRLPADAPFLAQPRSRLAQIRRRPADLSAEPRRLKPCSLDLTCGSPRRRRPRASPRRS